MRAESPRTGLTLSDARANVPVTAIAASAGGLEAVSELLAGLTPDLDMAYVYVQHLDPAHQSLLPEILSKRTPLHVVAATEEATVVSGTIYIIPPDRTLTIVEDQLRLSPRSPGRHMPADIFFKSLARARAERAISVVLSGGDSDGALGTVAIKHGGGITFAQDPSTAPFPSMPRNAHRHGLRRLRPATTAHR